MIKACLRRPTFETMRTAYRSFLPYILEQWWVNLDWMVLAELNGLGRTNPNIQKCMGTMKQVFSWLPLRTLCCKATAAFQALVLPRSRDVVAARELRHPSSPACQSETLCLQKLNMDVLPNQSHLIAACRHLINLIVRHFESWFPVCFAALAWYWGQMALNIVKLPAQSIHLNLARTHTCKSLATATCQCFAALPLQKMWNFMKRNDPSNKKKQYQHKINKLTSRFRYSNFYVLYAVR